MLEIWKIASLEGKLIIVILALFSVFVWSIMAAKLVQLRRAKNLNRLFAVEYQRQNAILDIHNRNVQVAGCPLYAVYLTGCRDLAGRLARNRISLKAMEHIKLSLERSVAQESLKLESGLILLAIAVSGSPFLGLLGTVWGVMKVFQDVALSGQSNLTIMAPGLSAAMSTTVAGLLVAIPAMFGYNWLVHTLRAMTVELDNFAQQFASDMETQYLIEDERS